MPDICLIFDCDGVLVDSELIAARVSAQWFADAGIPMNPADVLRRFTGLSGPKVTETVYAELGRPAPLRETERRGAAIMAALAAELQPMPGVDEALSAIHGPKCVASSSHPARIELALRVTGLAHHFGDHLFSAFSVDRGKPAPDLFLLAAHEMGVETAHCIVVEDSVPGVQAGKAAGMSVIGFVGGGHCGPEHHRDLLEAGADRIARHMSELPAMVVYERSLHRF